MLRDPMIQTENWALFESDGARMRQYLKRTRLRYFWPAGERNTVM